MEAVVTPLFTNNAEGSQDENAKLPLLIEDLRLKTISTTPNPHISKKYAPQKCHKMRGRMP